METGMSVILAALIGGGAGALGSMLIMNQRAKQFKQRFQQLRQEIESLRQVPSRSASNPEIFKTLDRLSQSMQADISQITQSQKQAQSQLQGEVGKLRKEVNQLKEAKRLDPLPSSLAKPAKQPGADLVKPQATLEANAVSPPEAPPEAPAADPGLENVEEAINWLAARQIGLESCHQPDPAVDALFNRVALELGNRYSSLADLHKKMKQNAAKGTRFMLSLADRNQYSQTDIKNCTQFCSHLHDASLLSFYRYDKTSKTIQAALHNRGDLTGFFMGKWFERFVYRKIADFLIAQNLPYKCLMNAKVKFANGDRYELDFLFLVESQPIWIECKTTVGQDKGYLSRYSGHAELLGIPKSRALLVILEIEPAQALEWTSLWSMTVLTKDQLTQAFGEALAAPPVQSTQPEKSAVPMHTPVLRLVKRASEPPPPVRAASAAINQPHRAINTMPQLSELFKKRMLQPYPGHRMTVIQALNQMFSEASYQPVSLKQLKENLAGRLKLSKPEVLQDVLRAILRSGCFLGDDGKTISTSNEPIVELIVPDPNWLDSQCVECYAAVVLSADLSYFDQPQNRQIFQQVVGSPAPDAVTLEQLRADLQSLSQAEENEEAVS